MRHLIREAGLGERVTLDSAGTGHWHAGERADPRSRVAASRRGFQISHRARQFTAADLDRFDLVLAMDRDNLATIRRMLGGRDTPRPRIELLRAFDASAPDDAEVPDPYAGGPEGFDHVLDLCERACRGLIDHVRDRL
jgi:protein-tyrosine phosphatase